MTDYTKTTGEGGTMMIRDTDTTIELWIKAGYTTTYAYGFTYSWVVNGTKGSATGNYPKGGSWVKLKTFSVKTLQSVSFTLGATGTQGLGGPTTLTAGINRYAGVRVNDLGKWYSVTPYVRDSGKWYPAQAYVRVSGKWVKCTL